MISAGGTAGIILGCCFLFVAFLCWSYCRKDNIWKLQRPADTHPTIPLNPISAGGQARPIARTSSGHPLISSTREQARVELPTSSNVQIHNGGGLTPPEDDLRTENLRSISRSETSSHLSTDSSSSIFSRNANHASTIRTSRMQGSDEAKDKPANVARTVRRLHQPVNSDICFEIGEVIHDPRDARHRNSVAPIFVRRPSAAHVRPDYRSSLSCEARPVPGRLVEQESLLLDSSLNTIPARSTSFRHRERSRSPTTQNCREPFTPRIPGAYISSSDTLDLPDPILQPISARRRYSETRGTHRPALPPAAMDNRAHLGPSNHRHNAYYDIEIESERKPRSKYREMRGSRLSSTGSYVRSRPPEVLKPKRSYSLQRET